MCSVDTVKTRLQGQPSANPPKYYNMFHAYGTILREEGVARGLYSGVAPAMTGSCKFFLPFLSPDEPQYMYMIYHEFGGVFFVIIFD